MTSWLAFGMFCMGLLAGDRLMAVPPEIIAHRGASRDAPENSVSSAKLAWERKSDAVEVDVYLSKDGEIVVYHDKTTKRIGGRDRAVRDQTLAELKELDVGAWKGEEFVGERIPTLVDIMRTVPRGKRLFIEVKAEIEIVPALAAQIRQWSSAAESAVVIAFSFNVALAVKKELPAVPVYWLVGFKEQKESGEWKPKWDDVIRRAVESGFEGLDVNDVDYLNREAVEAVHEAGLQLYVWTVNDSQRARELATWGVDGITTDRPGWLREELTKSPGDAQERTDRLEEAGGSDGGSNDRE